MKKPLLLFFFLVILTPLRSQYILAEMGGAGFVTPTISYGYLLQNDTLHHSNGTAFKAGIGYGNIGNVWKGPGYGLVRLGIHQVWGRRNNWQAGLEAGIHSHQKEYDLEGVFLYPSFGFRFGSGYLRGLISAGPLLIPFAPSLIFSGPVVVPFANVGVIFRL